MSRIVELVNASERYLKGVLDGDDLVTIIDEFVSGDSVYDLSDEDQILVHALQNQAALYVSDPIKRSEFEGYLSDVDIKVIVEAFIAESGDAHNVSSS